MNSKHNRRNFIRYSSLASASLFVPDFLKAGSPLSFAASNDEKVLVVIQLSGGNDGLNAVVPYRNDLYHKFRPALGLTNNEIFTLNDELALNKNMEGLASLYHDGYVSILNSVGYPNPNRSHFRSMDIWQSASDADKLVTTGWIGRTLDSACNNHCTKPYSAVEIDDTLSMAMKGEKMKGLAFRSVQSLGIATSNPLVKNMAEDYQPADNDQHNVEYLYKTLVNTKQSAEYIRNQSKIYSSKIIYPNHDFGKRMKLIAELINSRADIRVYYVSLPGFDTHVAQKGAQNRLLKVYADTLKCFCDDLKSGSKWNESLIMTFSEFGRRVSQNASNGTDHGTANNLYLIGGNLKNPGILNEAPDLKNLDNGDLIYKVDFRNVYATVLNKWLNTDSPAVLGKKFELMNFI